MNYLAKVYVSLKPTVNDPQGITVRGGLRNLGFEGVTGVRVGKYLEVSLEAASADEAEGAVKEMCRRLLANPVIEQSRFDVEEVSAGAPASP
jgi:phosphoribosylformylglycinamidine synthase